MPVALYFLMCENYGRGDCFNCYLMRRLRNRGIKLEKRNWLLRMQIKKIRKQIYQHVVETHIESE